MAGPKLTTLRALRGLPSVTNQTYTEIVSWITAPGLWAYTVGETLRHFSTPARLGVRRPDAATELSNLRNSDLAKVKAHRDEICQRVVKFLSPDQLSKWDSEIAKGKEFLGQKLDG